MQILNNKKLHNLFIYGIGQAVNLLSPLLVMPYIIYMCGEAGLGKVGVGFSLALILCGVVDYGSYIKGVREISVNRHDPVFLAEKIKAIYLSKFFLLIIIFLVFTLLLFIVPFFYKEKALFFFSLFIVVGQFINPAWFFQGIENFKWLSFLNLLSKGIYIACVFLFIKTKSDYIYANLFLAIGAILANSLGMVYIIKKYSVSIRSLSLKPAITIIKEEFTFTVSQVFLSVYQFFPIVIVSYIIGDYVAGQYKIIDQIIMILRSYLIIFFYFIYANVCYEVGRDTKAGMKVWKLYNGLNFIFVAIIVSVFYFCTDLIFTYFKISPEDLPVISSSFRIGLIIPLLLAVSLPLRQLMFAFDKNKVYIIITIATTLINLLFLIILTRHYQLAGSLISIIIIEFIIIVLYIFILRSHLRQQLQNSNEV